MKLSEYIATTALCLLAGYLVLMYGLVQPLQQILNKVVAMMTNLN